jgi:RNA polymerase sigma factor for flagellar operon FliA
MRYRKKPAAAEGGAYRNAEERGRELFETYHKTGDKKILKLLVERHIGIVRSIAHKVYTGKADMEYEDFVQIGLIGLLKSIDEYDPQSNVKFLAFAYPRIQGAMIDGMRDFTWLPRLVMNRSKRFVEAKEYLRGKENRSVSDAEVAAFLGLSRREYRDSSFSILTSLDGAAAASSGMKPDKEAEKSAIGEIVRKCLLKLPERERRAIYRHYFKGETWQDIAPSLGITPSRLSQIRNIAFSRLRCSLMRYEIKGGEGEWA